MNLEKIFKAYDIRGRVDTGEITPQLMQQIGAAFALYVDQDEIIVGRDCRLSSPQMSESFIKGVTSQNKDILYLGETTTDALCYSTVKQNKPGAMITASHNPSYFNGVKLCKAKAVPLRSQELEDLKNTIPANTASNHNGRGRVRHLDILPDYVDHLLTTTIDLNKLSRLKMAVDGGNGMVGLMTDQIFEHLPVELFKLYLDPDGNFPNHPANPGRNENLQDLISLIRQKSLNLGAAFDTDADRVVFVDDKGQPLPSSTIIALIARWYLLKKESNKTIVYDSICSQIVPKIIEKYGGKAVSSRIGFPFIRQMMFETDAIFGGETSGHYYFKENFAIDSGLLAMLVVLQIISESQKPLSILRQEFEHYAISGEIIFEVRDREEVIKKIEKVFASQADISHFEGLTVTWKNKWFNLRSSNTEPVIRLNIEGPNRKLVDQLTEQISKIVKKCIQTENKS